MNPQLGAAGLKADVEHFYRHVLRSAPADVADHAAALGWTQAAAQAALLDLERLRLARRAPEGTVVVDDPRATLGRLLDGEEAQLDERRRQLLAMRESLHTFELDYRRGLRKAGPRVTPWEHIAPSEAAAVVDRLARISSGDILQVVRRVEAGPAHDENLRRQWHDMAASGRGLRTIFPLSILSDPHWHAFAQERADSGEVQRYLGDEQLPVEFGLFGDAAVFLDADDPDGEALLLRTEALIAAFGALFEELWRRAEPVLNRDASARDRKLLELLALGFKDEAVARHLGLGLRTVRRQIASLMTEHGVDTRFQLGLAVARRGILGGRRR